MNFSFTQPDIALAFTTPSRPARDEPEAPGAPVAPKGRRLLEHRGSPPPPLARGPRLFRDSPSHSPFAIALGLGAGVGVGVGVAAPAAAAPLDIPDTAEEVHDESEDDEEDNEEGGEVHAAADDDSDDDSITSNKSVEGNYWLPYPPGMVKTPRTRFLTMLFNRLTLAEGGPGRLYAHAHRATVKTSSKDKENVWIYDAASTLWKLTTFDLWKGKVINWLSDACAKVAKECRTFVDEFADDKEMRQPWEGALAKVRAACTLFNQQRGSINTARFAFDRLLDEDFTESPNPDREVLSFKNGVLELRTLVFRARTKFDRLSYALSYDYDPSHPMDDFRQFMYNYFEDDATLEAAQNLIGYWFTGRTNQKALYEMICATNGGKTSLIEALAFVGEKYVRVGDVPIGEITTDRFQDTLASVLGSQPRPRLVVFDEGGKALEINQVLMNQLTDGKERHSLSMQIKHKGATRMGYDTDLHCKFLIASNHALRVGADSTGLVERKKTLALNLQFISPYDALTALPHERPRDAALQSRLQDPANRSGIVRWIAQGAYRSLHGSSLTCPRFEQAAFGLLVRGDPYLEWLTTTYTPTGLPTDRVILSVLVTEFKAAGRSASLNAGCYEGLKALMDSMRDFVTLTNWAEYGQELSGYAGLRQRKVGDSHDWLANRGDARAVAAGFRV